MNAKIILYYPPVTPASAFPTWEPLQLLHLSRMFRDTDIVTEIIDGRLYPEEERPEVIRRAMAEGALCLGITALTCFQILDALKVVQEVKKTAPRIPVVIGGWHATAFPDETLREEGVDIVVRGQGELSFREVVEKLRSGHDLGGTKGISWKKDGVITHEEDRPLAPPGDFPMLLPADFEKLDLQHYQIRNILFYMSSVGCPYSCTYCNVNSACRRKWIPLASETVAHELGGLYDRFHFGEVIFWDNVFFCDTKRVERICDFLIGRGSPFAWSAHARINEVIGWEDRFLAKVKASGCKSVFLGVESGSQRILDRIDKKIRATDIVPAFQKLRNHGIDVAVNWMVGFPDEHYRDIVESVRRMRDGLRVYDDDLTRFRMHIYRFVPFPRTPIFEQLTKDETDRLPKDAKEWGYYIFQKVSDGMEPWKEENTSSLFASTTFYLWKAYLQEGVPFTLRRRLLRMLSRARIKTGFLKLPVEWWLWKRKMRHEARV